MQDPAPGPYTPDQVPVETPFAPDEIVKKSGSKIDYSKTLLVFGIVAFVAIILVEAYILVQSGNLGPIQTPAYSGPTLEQ